MRGPFSRSPPQQGGETRSGCVLPATVKRGRDCGRCVSGDSSRRPCTLAPYEPPALRYKGDRHDQQMAVKRPPMMKSRELRIDLPVPLRWVQPDPPDRGPVRSVRLFRTRHIGVSSARGGVTPPARRGGQGWADAWKPSAPSMVSSPSYPRTARRVIHRRPWGES